MRRIGILGGSFNPIHNGHLHLAKSVWQQLGLDEILLMPAGIPPHKSDRAYASAEDRLEMCRLAAAEYAWCSVSDYEIRQTGKSYTVRTLRHLRQCMPDTQLFLLTGSDMLLSFTTWYRWQEILQLATLVAVSRGTEPQTDLAHQAALLLPYGEVVVLPVEPLPVSSTEIRMCVKFHKEWSCYLSEKVVQYIRLKKLYSGNC